MRGLGAPGMALTMIVLLYVVVGSARKSAASLGRRSRSWCF
jgi:hypothetical protein